MVWPGRNRGIRPTPLHLRHASERDYYQGEAINSLIEKSLQVKFAPCSSEGLVLKGIPDQVSVKSNIVIVFQLDKNLVRHPLQYQSLLKHMAHTLFMSRFVIVHVLPTPDICPSKSTLANKQFPVITKRRKNSKDGLPFNYSPSKMHGTNARGNDMLKCSTLSPQLYVHKSTLARVHNDVHEH